MAVIDTRWKRGVTLIELMLGIAIAAVIAAAAMSFFYTSHYLFAEGDSQSATQDSVRMAAAFVADEVRNAESIGVVDAPGGSGESIYIDGNRLWHKDESGTIKSLSQEDVNATSFTLHTVGGRWFMAYTITGPRGFEVTSEVLLNNIGWDESVPEITKNVINYNY